MKSIVLVVALFCLVIAAVYSEDTKDRSSYGGSAAAAPASITFHSGGLATGGGNILKGGSNYGGNAAAGPAAISFHSGGFDSGTTVLKFGPGFGGAPAPAVISLPSAGFATGAAIAPLPCPKNYLFSCQPSIQAAPCSHAIGSYGSVGAYSENNPVYA